jgi:type VI secretion system protein ImpL
MNPNPQQLPPLPPRPSSITKILTIISFSLALLTAGLWAIDKFLGREKFMVILMILLVFLGALALIWLIIWLIRKMISLAAGSRERRREELEAAQRKGASPEEQAELDGLQEQVNLAVRVLRESKLAKGKKADEVLYSLPWILLLGPDESGKTTVLRECGVEFPYTTAEERKSARGRVAGCDFWFSRGAIMVDLAGRIGVDDEGFGAFKGFLDQLRRARKERPLDGVVVTVSISEVLNRPADEVERMANRLRHRFDEMIKRLGIRFPIYVLFTHGDQVEGFQEFFGNMRSRDRAQVWGATISRSQRKRLPAEQIFAQEFDRLVEGLSCYRLPLLASEKDPGKQPLIYTFPARVAALRERLTSFMGALLQPTPYSERPLFRGFYLTSAAGGPARAASQAREIPQQWEPGRRFATTEEQPKAATRSFFLENLFPQVIFADRLLATASVDTRLRRRLWLDVVFFGTLVICLTLLVGMIFSFMENRTLLESARQAALTLVDAGWDGRRTSDLIAMEDFHQRVEELDKYQTEGPRWALRWGLYSGSDIEPAVRRVYFRKLRDTFVTPTAESLRRKLNGFASGTDTTSSYDDFYTCLKAYLMMTEPPRAEESFLYNALAPTWKGPTAKDAESVALKQLRFYAQQLSKNDPELQLTQDGNIVARARRALSQFPVLVRLYTRLKNEGSTKLQPYTLALATGGKSLEYLNSSHDVPGIFTEIGWRTYFKNAVAQATKDVVKDDWVMGPTYSYIPSGQISDADYAGKILDMYFADYSAEWSRFLEGVTVRPLADLTEATNALDSFSQQDSALSRLLMNVAAQTMLRRNPEQGGSITDMVSGALATLGLSAKVNREELVAVVADQFAPLHDLVTSPDGKSPALSAQYVDVLGRMHSKLVSLFGAGTQWEQVKAYVGMIATSISGDEFHDGYRVTSRIAQMCRSRSTQPIGALLEQPLRQSWSAILREVGYKLDGLWKSRIADSYRRDVESRFPFNPNGQDLPLSMLAQYLKPGEGSLWAFYEGELKMFLTPAENQWAPASLFGAPVDFAPAFLEFLGRANAVRQALYGSGGADPSVTFDLTPEPTPGVTESLLDIDSQKLLYRNERALPQPFTWPGKMGSPQAKITISITGSGERPNIPAIDGEWALFRLINRASVQAQTQTTYSINWSLPSADGRRFDVRYKLQARNVQNPFLANFFSRVRCPEKVTQLSVMSRF